MKLKVMSLNLRFDLANDGINSFEFRKKNILEAINSQSPDLIGFQEATDTIRYFLRENLTDYIVLGGGRDKEYLGEASCIAYKKHDFELVAFEREMFSLTPNIFGTRHRWSDQSGCPRMFVHATLKHKEIEKPVNLFNTHFDHWGEQARIVEMVQVLQSISKCGGNVVFMGDLNAKPSSPVVAMPLSTGLGLQLQECTKDIKITFHNYGKITTDNKIDYIYTDAHTVSCYTVEDAHVDGVYISDHYPICAEIDFE